MPAKSKTAPPVATSPGDEAIASLFSDPSFRRTFVEAFERKETPGRLRR